MSSTIDNPKFYRCHPCDEVYPSKEMAGRGEEACKKRRARDEYEGFTERVLTTGGSGG